MCTFFNSLALIHSCFLTHNTYLGHYLLLSDPGILLCDQAWDDLVKNEQRDRIGSAVWAPLKRAIPINGLINQYSKIWDQYTVMGLRLLNINLDEAENRESN